MFTLWTERSLVTVRFFSLPETIINILSTGVMHLLHVLMKGQFYVNLTDLILWKLGDFKVNATRHHQVFLVTEITGSVFSLELNDPLFCKSKFLVKFVMEEKKRDKRISTHRPFINDKKPDWIKQIVIKHIMHFSIYM